MLTKDINDYAQVVGEETIERIRKKAEHLKAKRILQLSSTKHEGGVAEILQNMVPLFRSLGIDMDWKTINEPKEFLEVTKDFHNMLQGQDTPISNEQKETYLENLKANASEFNFSKYDLIIVHDAPPLALIDMMDKKVPWIWRCHIDLSEPHEGLWKFLSTYLKKYDQMVISIPEYSKKLIEETIIAPSIDPLSEKNRDMSEEEMRTILEKYRVPTDKPIISQISRYDKWKDPIGVIMAYKEIKKYVDCRLVLIGNSNPDDPEGPEILEAINEAAEGDDDIFIFVNVEDNDILINTIQRKSDVVLQKSTKEGFGLTVSEALWKATPVIGGKVGGIPLQIIDGVNGYLVHSIEECASRLKHLMKDKSLQHDMGKKAKESVLNKFLITRHIEDYIDMMNEII